MSRHNGSRRFLRQLARENIVDATGPHATRLSAELEAHDDWIVGELKRRARAAEESRRVLKLHAGEHPAFVDPAPGEQTAGDPDVLAAANLFNKAVR
jgi:hypothetical protein